MDGALYDNDISHVVEADRAHVWHHLIQHKPLKPMTLGLLSKARELRFGIKTEKNMLTESLAAFGPLTSAMGAKALLTRCATN